MEFAGRSTETKGRPKTSEVVAAFGQPPLPKPILPKVLFSGELKTLRNPCALTPSSCKKRVEVWVAVRLLCQLTTLCCHVPVPKALLTGSVPLLSLAYSSTVAHSCRRFEVCSALLALSNTTCTELMTMAASRAMIDMTTSNSTRVKAESFF